MRALRREHPGLTSDLARLAGNDARRVLLVSLTATSPSRSGCEGILAKAIELHGGRVIAARLPLGTPWSGALFRALGTERPALLRGPRARRRAVLDATSGASGSNAAGRSPTTRRSRSTARASGGRRSRQSSAQAASRRSTSTTRRSGARSANTIEYALRTLYVADRALDTVAAGLPAHRRARLRGLRLDLRPRAGARRAGDPVPGRPPRRRLLPEALHARLTRPAPALARRLDVEHACSPSG